MFQLPMYHCVLEIWLDDIFLRFDWLAKGAWLTEIWLNWRALWSSWGLIKSCLLEIWLVLYIYPEGTTTNGFYLLPFKTGAFLAGTPIQPVILRYPYIHFSPAWETISGASNSHVLLLTKSDVEPEKMWWYFFICFVYFPESCFFSS